MHHPHTAEITCAGPASTSSMSSIQDWNSKEHFVEVTQELLALEREEEKQERACLFARAGLDVLERRGVCLRRLEVQLPS